MTDTGSDANPQQGEEPNAVAGEKRTFGGLSASEAARRRWEQKRERDAATAAADAGTTEGVFVRVPIRVAEVIRRLESDAAKGSAQAARELRAWLAEFPRDDGDMDVRTLTSRARRALLAKLMAELAAEQSEVVSEF